NMPEVSIVLAAYQSNRTLGGCLEALSRQTFRDFELVIVDSGSDDGAESVVRRQCPEARYWRSPDRLLAHAALNRGVGMSSGRLLAFTDPDAYARPDWLERLVRAHRETGRVVVGAVACYGRRWLDVGAHLCKFDGWLPGGGRREIDLAPTVNAIIDRALFELEGRFLDDHVHADTDFSWRLASHGHRLLFEPAAVVEHHHLHTWPSLLRERFDRGRSFARLWMNWTSPSPARLAWWAAASMLPLRLASQVWRASGRARCSGWWGVFLGSLPVFVSGRWAWLMGELAEYLPVLLTRRPGARLPDQTAGAPEAGQGSNPAPGSERAGPK
ncbi:MAG: glycosyltransferase, partial [Anaerolineales bacterium]